jgi:hypothetical protein
MPGSRPRTRRNGHVHSLAMLGDEGLEDGDDLLLLPARQLRGGVKKLPHLATFGRRPLGLASQKLLNGASERLGNAGKQLGPGHRVVVLPVLDVGVLDAHPTGQLSLGNPSGDAEALQAGIGDGLAHGQGFYHKDLECGQKTVHF